MSVFKRPEGLPPSQLNKLRIADIKQVILFTRSFPDCKLSVRSGAVKAEYCSGLLGILKTLFSRGDKDSYEKTLSFIRYLAPGLSRCSEFIWCDGSIHPVPDDIDWSTQLPANYQFAAGHSPPMSRFRPGSSNSGASSTMPTTSEAGSEVAWTSEMLSGLAYCDAGFTSPACRVGRTAIWSETAVGGRSARHLVFRLLPSQLALLATNTNQSEAAQHGVYLYMCPLSTAKDTLDASGTAAIAPEFPDGCTVSSAKGDISRTFISTSSMELPIDITDMINWSHNMVHMIQVSYQSNDAWVATVMMATRQTVTSAQASIVGSNRISAQTVLEQMFNSADAVDEDEDEDAIEAGACLTMRCPLGLSRIRTPVRSLRCTHPQCFDLENFLELNSQMQTWECPVCSLAIGSWKDLLVDEFFQQILDSVLEDENSVTVCPDGTWEQKTAVATEHTNMRSGSCNDKSIRDIPDTDSDDESVVEEAIAEALPWADLQSDLFKGVISMIQSKGSGSSGLSLRLSGGENGTVKVGDDGSFMVELLDSISQQPVLEVKLALQMKLLSISEIGSYSQQR